MCKFKNFCAFGAHPTYFLSKIVRIKADKKRMLFKCTDRPRLMIINLL